MFLLRHVCALLSQTLVTGAILKGGQDTTRARKMPENKCEGFLHGSLSRVGMIRRVIQVAQITLPIHPDNPHLTTTTRHVMVGITRSKVIFYIHEICALILSDDSYHFFSNQMMLVTSLMGPQHDGYLQRKVEVARN